MPDFILTGRSGDTVYLLDPQTEEAQSWLNDNIGDESNFLGRALAVEHRYIDGVIAGIRGDGLTVI